MAQRPGDELAELDSRQEPRLVKALEMVAPGTALREGLDNIVHARTGGLIVIGDPDELSFLFSGGIKLDIDYTPALLYQVAKMDGALVLNSNATRIAAANVQLMPDPTILSLETGTRHRTAERVSKQTDALVIAVSQRREVVSLYVDGAKYILEDIPVVLAKANQALATLDKYRTRLDQVSPSRWPWRAPRGASRPTRRRWRASARSGSPASCARSPIPTSASRRRRSSGWPPWSRRDGRLPCGRRSAAPSAPLSAPRAPLDTELTTLRSD